MATRLVNKIKDDMAPYCQFPRSGPARDQLAKGLRAGFSGNYVVYYRPAETELTVIRILHGARDMAAISSSGGFG
jgi:toxin ParE1/3/4